MSSKARAWLALNQQIAATRPSFRWHTTRDKGGPIFIADVDTAGSIVTNFPCPAGAALLFAQWILDTFGEPK